MWEAILSLIKSVFKGGERRANFEAIMDGYEHFTDSVQKRLATAEIRIDRYEVRQDVMELENEDLKIANRACERRCLDLTQRLEAVEKKIREPDDGR